MMVMVDVAASAGEKIGDDDDDLVLDLERK